MQVTFTNKFPITFLHLKFLIDVMLHWHLYTTVIWNCWWPSPCEFVLSFHHICINWYEQAPHRRFRKCAKLVCWILPLLHPLNCSIYPLLMSLWDTSYYWTSFILSLSVKYQHKNYPSFLHQYCHFKLELTSQIYPWLKHIPTLPWTQDSLCRCQNPSHLQWNKKGTKFPIRINLTLVFFLLIIFIKVT